MSSSQERILLKLVKELQSVRDNGYDGPWSGDVCEPVYAALHAYERSLMGKGVKQILRYKRKHKKGCPASGHDAEHCGGPCACGSCGFTKIREILTMSNIIKGSCPFLHTTPCTPNCLCATPPHVPLAVCDVVRSAPSSKEKQKQIGSPAIAAKEEVASRHIADLEAQLKTAQYWRERWCIEHGAIGKQNHENLKAARLAKSWKKVAKKYWAREHALSQKELAKSFSFRLKELIDVIVTLCDHNSVKLCGHDSNDHTMTHIKDRLLVCTRCGFKVWAASAPRVDIADKENDCDE